MNSGESPVEQYDFSNWPKDNIAGFDVTMDHALPVGVRHDIADSDKILRQLSECN